MDKEISLAIKTFMRENCLFRLLDSINQFLPDLKIYIADDSEISNKREKYRELEKRGHKIIRLPFNVGLSAGRNALMKTISEPFVLYCDDDFIFSSDNGVKETLEIIKKRKDIGMICGLLTCDGIKTGFGNIMGKWENGIIQVNKGLNFFIAQTKMFKDIKWNEKYKINKEHKDFFKRLKKTKWKVYYNPELTAEHSIQKGSAEYEKYRKREEQ